MPVRLHNPKRTPKDVQMFLQASAHALTVIMKTNLINDIIYHFHTRPTKNFPSTLHKRNTNNRLNLKCKNAQISVSFKHPVGHYPSYSWASKRTVITFILHVPMLNVPVSTC